MSADEKLLITVVNWNSSVDTLKCLGPLAGRWPTLIVDNASDDLEYEKLQDSPHEILRLSSNLGYAGGVNAALRLASDRNFGFVLVLNPDSHPSRGVVDAMIRASEGAAIVGIRQSQSQNLEDEYQTAAFVRGLKVVDTPVTSEADHVHVDVVSGAALMIDVRVAQEVGLFDERFFHYKEEFDFCWRVSEAGHTIRRVNSEVLVHDRGGSLSGESPSGRYYKARNELLFFNKHLGRFGWVRARGHLLRAVTPLRKTWSAYRADLRGVFDGVRNRSGKLGS